MTLKNLLVVNAIVALFLGVALALSPASFLSVFGITLPREGLLIARLFGAAILGNAALMWLARDVEGSEARRVIVGALTIGFAVGFVVALPGQLSGVVNSTGWLIVSVYLLAALGYGYFHFIKVGASERPSGSG